MGPLEVRVRKPPLLTNQLPHRSSKQTACVTSHSAIPAAAREFPPGLAAAAVPAARGPPPTLTPPTRPHPAAVIRSRLLRSDAARTMHGRESYETGRRPRLRGLRTPAAVAAAAHPNRRIFSVEKGENGRKGSGMGTKRAGPGVRGAVGVDAIV
nr:unnamed protein product [Digitaria exilis]